MTKKTSSAPITFKRHDCDRIWITSHDAGPVLHWKKQLFTDTNWLTGNDLKLALRVIARYLGKEYMLVPLNEAPAILADPFGEKLPKMLEAGKPVPAPAAKTVFKGKVRKS